ncbi:MAG: PDZ domain-containing protein [Rhodobacteraceae bacterium]|nr:PDZ domain-containing protein [Paracoccaceae bacterium]
MYTASVLRAGFTEISQKALAPPPLDELFLAGLENVRVIDPGLRVDVTPSDLILVSGNRKLGVTPRPDADDMRGWIATTILLFNASEPSPDNRDPEVLFKMMFNAALAKIDGYSRYAGRGSARTNRANRNGVIGLGLTFDVVDEGLIIRSTIENGPAETAGVRDGDLIVAIDDHDLAGATRDEAMRYLSGPSGSRVKLTIRHASDTQLSVAHPRRGLVIPKTVKAQRIGDVARISVGSFNIRTASDVAATLNRLKREAKTPLSGIVLDMRGDPGGLLDQAVALADMFLDSGTIATLSGRHPGAKQFYAASPGDIADGLPLVLVVDGKSASASEILAAALIDNERAVVVGTNTLGKGSVQTLIRLPNDGEIALTWSRVMAPAGYFIHELGILPTICTSGHASGETAALTAVAGDPVGQIIDRQRWLANSGAPDERAELRRICPAENRNDGDFDMALALKLASDRALYARSFTTNLAESH